MRKNKKCVILKGYGGGESSQKVKLPIMNISFGFIMYSTGTLDKILYILKFYEDINL